MVKDIDMTISNWDPSEFIESEEDAIAYLNAAAELDDPAVLQAAIGDVAKARGMGQIAKGSRRRARKPVQKPRQNGNPSFRAIAKVVKSLGGRLVISPIKPSET